MRSPGMRSSSCLLKSNEEIKLSDPAPRRRCPSFTIRFIVRAKPESLQQVLILCDFRPSTIEAGRVNASRRVSGVPVGLPGRVCEVCGIAFHCSAAIQSCTHPPLFRGVALKQQFPQPILPFGATRHSCSSRRNLWIWTTRFKSTHSGSSGFILRFRRCKQMEPLKQWTLRPLARTTVAISANGCTVRQNSSSGNQRPTRNA